MLRGAHTATEPAPHQQLCWRVGWGTRHTLRGLNWADSALLLKITFCLVIVKRCRYFLYSPRFHSKQKWWWWTLLNPEMGVLWQHSMPAFGPPREAGRRLQRGTGFKGPGPVQEESVHWDTCWTPSHKKLTHRYQTRKRTLHATAPDKNYNVISKSIENIQC